MAASLSLSNTSGIGAARPVCDIFRDAPENRALHVLVVDDEALIRWALSQTLSDHGLTVVAVPDGESALAALAAAEVSFDVVLLDYRLPDSNGLNLLATIRGAKPMMPIVMMTAHATPELIESAMLCGAHSVLQKPFDMPRLVEVVRQAYRDRRR